MALILHEKLTRLPYNNYWSKHKCQDRNFKTHNGFIQKMAPLIQKHISQAEHEKLLLLLCPLNYIEADYKIDLLQEIKERDIDEVLMKPAALGTIHTLYREQNWLHIYTDGSATNRNGNAAAGIHCKLFSFYLSLGQHATHFDGETEAMNTALRQLFSRTGSFKKAIIFSDSTAAILPVAKFVALTRKMIPQLHSSIKLLKSLKKFTP
jgi:hypothetical protein